SFSVLTGLSVPPTDTPLMVRSSSELVLSRSLDIGSRDTDNNHRPTATVSRF
ncbi:par-3 family cell polarity regulator beta a isoform X1, partial [Tachysurus ichikawai]